MGPSPVGGVRARRELPLYRDGAVGLSPAAAGDLRSIPVTVSLTICAFFVVEVAEKRPS